MIRWMCGVKLNERKKSKELLGLEPVSLVIKKSRLRWYGRKDYNDWVRHDPVMGQTWVVVGIRQRGRPKKT